MKDDRKILRGVRVGNETITDPDELAKVATPEQLADLLGRGYLSGTWGEGKGKAEAADSTKASDKKKK